MAPASVAALVDPSLGPATLMEGELAREKVQSILVDLRARIPELSYRMFVMHCMEDRTVSQIAAEFGVSEGLVKMRLHRVRRVLEGLLRRGGLGNVEIPG